MLLEGNHTASTRGTLQVMQVVGLILCGQTSQISRDDPASAGVFILDFWLTICLYSQDFAIFRIPGFF